MWLLCYIIQAVAWDRAEKYRCPWGTNENPEYMKWKKLLTNVDEHDILDKLFRTTEMNGTDSEKEK